MRTSFILFSITSLLVIAGISYLWIARIRNGKPRASVLFPPFHRVFSTPVGLLEFLQQLRELSGGKPVGFKFCLGRRSEFIAICKAIIKTGIYPDFIAVDGGEEGTGAAPLESSNSVGTPYQEGLVFVYDTLIGFGLKRHIKLIAAGKILTGSHILRSPIFGSKIGWKLHRRVLCHKFIRNLKNWRYQRLFLTPVAVVRVGFGDAM